MARTPAEKIEAAEEMLPEAAQEQIEALREHLEDLDGQVRRVVKDHPFATLLGAVAAGYLIGRVVARF